MRKVQVLNTVGLGHVIDVFFTVFFLFSFVNDLLFSQPYKLIKHEHRDVNASQDVLSIKP
jgi:hypothetical protein